MINKFIRKGEKINFSEHGQYVVISESPHVLQPVVCPNCSDTVNNQVSFVAVVSLSVIFSIVFMFYF